MIESFLLPFQFDIAKVCNDLDKFAEAEWLPHFNTSYYSGNWNGLSLRSPGGNPNSLYPAPNINSEYNDTPLMPHFNSVGNILARFECPLHSVRFLRLEKGAIIREHSDNALSFEDGEVRLHIPIITNDQIEFISNGKQLQLRAGQCWYINAGLPHSVANHSETDRIHLVIDCRVNDWLRSYFPKIDYEETNRGMSSVRSEKDIALMIELLENMGTQTSLQMAEELKKNKLLNTQL